MNTSNSKMSYSSIMLHYLQHILSTLLSTLEYSNFKLSLVHWNNLTYTRQMAPYFLWGLKDQECELSLSTHMLNWYMGNWSFLYPSGESVGWWHTLTLSELSRFFCQSLRTFVKIFVGTRLYNLRNLLFQSVSLH